MHRASILNVSLINKERVGNDVRCHLNTTLSYINANVFIIKNVQLKNVKTFSHLWDRHTDHATSRQLLAPLAMLAMRTQTKQKQEIPKQFGNSRVATPLGRLQRIKSQFVTMVCPTLTPQNCPFPFDDLHPHLLHPSLDRSHSLS